MSGVGSPPIGDLVGRSVGPGIGGGFTCLLGRLRDIVGVCVGVWARSSRHANLDWQRRIRNNLVLLPM
jgi:hypothetical protein